MTRDDEIIRDALWPMADAPADARFTAQLLYRMGRRRRVLGWAVRLVMLAGTALAAAILAPVILLALAPLGPRIDGLALTTSLILLFACAILAPARA